MQERDRRLGGEGKVLFSAAGFSRRTEGTVVRKFETWVAMTKAGLQQWAGRLSHLAQVLPNAA